MEKVVYLLGAGFSAPLGIPVMSNFLTRSKDMYFRDPAAFPHFLEVFETINELSVIKNYYSADLFNIEEILSILEMREFLEGERLKENFTRYIADVVKAYTPEIVPYKPKLPNNWIDVLFGHPNRSFWSHYAHFVGSVCNLEFQESRLGFTGEPIQINCRVDSEPKTMYSIVTLNYDLVPESVLDFISHTYSCETKINLQIAKLHGSVDTGVIVPPTWSKGVNRDIIRAWKQAYDYLTEANHLRIIGYSLPTADAYLKYLLKSAVTKAPHLKAIDVICLDSDGTTQKRYDEFISFASYYRFRNLNTFEYLKRIRPVSYSIPQQREVYKFDSLESVPHSCFT